MQSHIIKYAIKHRLLPLHAEPYNRTQGHKAEPSQLTTQAIKAKPFPITRGAIRPSHVK